jgi:hypothetical protein
MQHRCDYLPSDRFKEGTKGSSSSKRTTALGASLLTGHHHQHHHAAEASDHVNTALLLDQVSDVCVRARIPYVIIVKPHVLRQRGCVKVMATALDSKGTAPQVVTVKTVTVTS